MWHVSFRSGVATLRTAIHLLLTVLLTYFGLPLLRYAQFMTAAAKVNVCQVNTATKRRAVYRRRLSLEVERHWTVTYLLTVVD